MFPAWLGLLDTLKLEVRCKLGKKATCTRNGPMEERELGKQSESC